MFEIPSRCWVTQQHAEVDCKFKNKQTKRHSFIQELRASQTNHFQLLQCTHMDNKVQIQQQWFKLFTSTCLRDLMDVSKLELQDHTHSTVHPTLKETFVKNWLKSVSPDKYSQTLCQCIYKHAHKKAATQSIQLTGYCNTTYTYSRSVFWFLCYPQHYWGTTA